MMELLWTCIESKRESATKASGPEDVIVLEMLKGLLVQTIYATTNGVNADSKGNALHRCFGSWCCSLGNQTPRRRKAFEAIEQLLSSRDVEVVLVSGRADAG